MVGRRHPVPGSVRRHLRDGGRHRADHVPHQRREAPAAEPAARGQAGRVDRRPVERSVPPGRGCVVDARGVRLDRDGQGHSRRPHRRGHRHHQGRVRGRRAPLGRAPREAPRVRPVDDLPGARSTREDPRRRAQRRRDAPSRPERRLDQRQRHGGRDPRARHPPPRPPRGARQGPRTRLRGERAGRRRARRGRVPASRGGGRHRVPGRPVVLLRR